MAITLSPMVQEIIGKDLYESMRDLDHLAEKNRQKRKSIKAPPETVREVMVSRMEDLLRKFVHLTNSGKFNATEMIIKIYAENFADEAFSCCGISKKEQEEPW